MKKQIKLVLIILIILLELLNFKCVYASNENEEEYTELYKKYLELSQEEKNKVKVIPVKYKTKNNSSSGIINAKASTTNLPSRFNLADTYSFKVENQGKEGVCWAFASLECIESYLQIHGQGIYDFSESHLDYLESDIFTSHSESELNRELHGGGNFMNFVDYAKKSYGPVLEEDFPYGVEYTSQQYPSLLNVTPEAFLRSYMQFDEVTGFHKQLSLFNNYVTENRNSIKQHIMEKSTVSAFVIAPQYFKQYYNSKTYSSYIPASTNISSVLEYGHMVSIVGWDDNYSRENFNLSCRPAHDGAYIVLNSWGEEFGNKGYYYISYDDAYIEMQTFGVANAEINTANSKSLEDATITLSKEKYQYNGQLRKPAVTVKYGNKTLTRNTDYKLLYKDNDRPGYATVVIKGIGKYSGRIEKKYEIKPYSPTSISATYRNNGFRVTWNVPDNIYITGYQIQYSNYNNFSTILRTKTITQRKEKIIFDNLPKGIYYIRVRSYTQVGNNVTKSLWSPTIGISI